MVPVDMSMEARMVLAKMSFIYERERGERVKIMRDEDIVRLINYAVESINKELQKNLQAFVKICTASELRELASQGANIYRGAVVPEEDAFPTMDVSKPATVMYRGVAVPASESQQVNSMEAKATQTPMAGGGKEEAKPKKPKRVYRGRVIED